MNHHPIAFFSKADIARFSSHLAKQGIKILDRSFSFPESNHSTFLAYDSSLPVANVLPTAKQCQTIREEQERIELQRHRENGDPYVTIDSLPLILSPRSNEIDGAKCGSKSCHSQQKVQRQSSASSQNGDDNDESEGELSDELIDFDEEEQFIRKEHKSDNNNITSKCHHSFTKTPTDNTNLQTNNSKSLKISSQAIDSSTTKKSLKDANTKTTTNDDGWHSRRSKSDVALARKERNSLMKKRRRTSADLIPTSADDLNGREEDQGVSRPTLRFMAAPGVANKRKKQMTLLSMFKK